MLGVNREREREIAHMRSWAALQSENIEKAPWKRHKPTHAKVTERASQEERVARVCVCARVWSLVEDLLTWANRLAWSAVKPQPNRYWILLEIDGIRSGYALVNGARVQNTCYTPHSPSGCSSFPYFFPRPILIICSILFCAQSTASTLCNQIIHSLEKQ